MPDWGVHCTATETKREYGMMRPIDMKRQTKVAISLVYYAGLVVLSHLRGMTGRPFARRLTILYYHGVSTEQRLSFARQMNALHRNARVLPASYRGKLPPGRTPVAITFDDALVSVAEIALPELANYSFHSTVFVPVGWLGRSPGWMMEDNEVAAGAESPKRADVVMSVEQLKSLSKSLVSLGSHSLTHPSIVDQDTREARLEIEDSRRQLEELTGREILDFSFPYGAHDVPTVAMCRSAGYTSVYSIESQGVDTSNREFLRGRTKADPSDGPLEFFLKFNGAYQWTAYTGPFMKALRSLLGRQSPGVRILTR
jgi:peptidoglycan/xylan/chitin deacetylase (PgdA/CDA1 family)